MVRVTRGLALLDNLSERKQGSGPNGTKSCRTRGLSFVLPELVEGLKRTN